MEESRCLFYELKSKMGQATTHYFVKIFFFKPVFDFPRSPKILCHKFGRQNHWSLVRIRNSAAGVLNESYRQLRPLSVVAVQARHYT
jgi:hypothetical protein